MFSNKYIILYSAILVIVVATILSLATSILQPFYEDNVKIEKINYILNAAGIDNSEKNAIEIYNKVVFDEFLLDINGNKVKSDKKAFDINIKEELDKIKDNVAETALFPVFLCKNANDTLIILPIYGKGLWGPVWGYVALEQDCNTIRGVVFDHKGETPGLGAEISEKQFQQHFVGKKIFDKNDNFVSVSIIKPNDRSALEENRVDAISGGTMTSKGLNLAIKDVLGIYAKFLKNHHAATESTNDIVINDTEIIDEIEDTNSEAELAKAKEAELAKAKETELAKAKEAELAKAKEAELAKAKEAELAKVKAKEAELAKAKEAELAKAKELAKAVKELTRYSSSFYPFKRQHYEESQRYHRTPDTVYDSEYPPQENSPQE
jgi:Na+-transporting NADH:ubiquinone oxidoreductase subunit C